ncbi:MAG TPA: HEPN domain-containing protein [Longimicrobiales bacterium]|nr:HEPN domain-containing protein [Longimicrobiales bacterium]
MPISWLVPPGMLGPLVLGRMSRAPATSSSSAADYIRRATIRLRAVDVLFESGSWADVVRESQEIVEFTLNALLRSIGIDPPRIHDVSDVLVSDVLVAERERLPGSLVGELEALTRASKQLRRDLELAFYGAEDLTPSGFYSREDGERARASARRTVELVSPHVAEA